MPMIASDQTIEHNRKRKTYRQMKFIETQILLAAMMIAVFCGCTRTTDEVRTIEIDPILTTRVTALNFETGDEIGIRIERPTGIYIDHAAMIYGGNSFVASDLLWYDNEEESCTITAYYPYRAGAFPTEFTIPTDQSVSTTDADLLGAMRTGVKPSASPVQMQFYHLLSRLVITVTNESDNTLSAVQIGGLIPTATPDWTVPTATAKSDVAAAAVTAFPRVAGSQYEAILVPQQGTMSVTLTTTNGKQYNKSVAATLSSGKSYALAVTLLKDDVAVVLSGEIVDWGDGGDLDSGADVSPTVQAGTVTIGGEEYATRAIGNRVWMAENLRYLPEGLTVGSGVWYPSGEAANVSTLGYLYNYATVTTAALCPSGWHVPTGEELATLIGADCGENFFTPAGMCSISTDNTADYKENSYLISSTATEEGRCSVLLFTADGATEIKPMRQTYGFSLRCIKDAE